MLNSVPQELQKHNVSTVVRVCEPSYKKDVLEGAGIEVRDLAYEDGTFPPPNIVDEWFEVLKQKWVLMETDGNCWCWWFWWFFQIQRESRWLCGSSLRGWVGSGARPRGAGFNRVGTQVRRRCRVDKRVSCASAALIDGELNFFPCFFHCRKRRGAINAKQLSYLEKYRPKSRLKHRNGHKNSCCVQ